MGMDEAVVAVLLSLPFFVWPLAGSFLTDLLTQ